ncbi:hypothetical protein JAAARDRAFT_703378, partial [Jaapia argillacea MUCL 33604]
KRNPAKSSRLVGDGLPWLLTGDVFYEKVVMHEAHQAEEQEAKETRQGERERKAELMAKWKIEDEARVKWNQDKCLLFNEKLAEWRVEQAVAKTEKRHPKWRKPVPGVIEKPIPRPTASTIEEEDEEDGEDAGDDDE